MPMPPAVKVILWVLGILVALLFLAAIWRAQRVARGPPPKSKASKTRDDGSCPRSSLPSAGGEMAQWVSALFQRRLCRCRKPPRVEQSTDWSVATGSNAGMIHRMQPGRNQRACGRKSGAFFP